MLPVRCETFIVSCNCAVSIVMEADAVSETSEVYSVLAPLTVHTDFVHTTL
jgi:hypothetical protein